MLGGDIKKTALLLDIYREYSLKNIIVTINKNDFSSLLWFDNHEKGRWFINLTNKSCGIVGDCYKEAISCFENKSIKNLFKLY